MKKFSVLVIENDPDEQILIQEAFEETDRLELRHMLGTGRELLPYLRHQDEAALPDLILSELLMPVKDGFDVLLDIFSDARYRTIPVYIMSTSALDAVIEKCVGLGAAAYIEKPDQLQDYTAFLERLYAMAVQGFAGN